MIIIRKITFFFIKARNHVIFNIPTKKNYFYASISWLRLCQINDTMPITAHKAVPHTSSVTCWPFPSLALTWSLEPAVALRPWRPIWLNKSSVSLVFQSPASWVLRARSGQPKLLCSDTNIEKMSMKIVFLKYNILISKCVSVRKFTFVFWEYHTILDDRLWSHLTFKVGNFFPWCYLFHIQTFYTI